MREAPGNLWNTPDSENDWRVITTNLSVGVGGNAVMGRGTAFQASVRYPTIKKRLGLHIQKHEDRLAVFPDWRLICFPVKFRWNYRADLRLIRQSALALREFSQHQPGARIWMTRPGCHNGHRDWQSEVCPIIRDVLPDTVTVLYWRT
jgi:hypothetical protein